MTNSTLEAATEWRRRSEVYTRIRSGSTHTNQGPSDHDNAALKWSEEIPQRNRATKLSANIPDASEARSSARKSCSPRLAELEHKSWFGTRVSRGIPLPHINSKSLIPRKHVWDSRSSSKSMDLATEPQQRLSNGHQVSRTWELCARHQRPCTRGKARLALSRAKWGRHDLSSQWKLSCQHLPCFEEGADIVL
jgi:hypothetical protein